MTNTGRSSKKLSEADSVVMRAVDKAFAARRGGRCPPPARSRVAFVILLGALLTLSCSSCGPTPETELFLIRHHDKSGYIDRKGNVVIQPQYEAALPFSEGLAVACPETDKCGFIDQTGRFVVPARFKIAWRFSGGLAAVKVEDKVGYIDKTGRMVIDAQFEGGMTDHLTFAEGLACVKVGGKFGFIGQTGATVINPQFDEATPFFEGLAAVAFNKKVGFIDKDGKFVINPQFDGAEPFANGLAAVKVGAKFGYVDKTGRIVISPAFDTAYPFSAEGLALIVQEGKIGFINKSGGYEINPQFKEKNIFLPLDWGMAFIVTPEIGRVSFSEGLAPVGNGEGKVGYIDGRGRFVITPQFEMGLPFYNGLALTGSDGGLAWVDREGRVIWRGTPVKPSPTPAASSNAAANVNAPAANTAASAPAANTAGGVRAGRLITDANLRSAPDKGATSVGIHFRNARVQILDERRYERDGEVLTWYRVRVVAYGSSPHSNVAGGKNSPNDADEGWVNAKLVLPD